MKKYFMMFTDKEKYLLVKVLGEIAAASPPATKPWLTCRREVQYDFTVPEMIELPELFFKIRRARDVQAIFASTPEEAKKAVKQKKEKKK